MILLYIILVFFKFIYYLLKTWLSSVYCIPKLKYSTCLHCLELFPVFLVKVKCTQTHNTVKITISDFASNKGTILLLYVVPDHLGTARASRIHSSVSHRFLALLNQVNQRPQQLLLNAHLESKCHNVCSHIVLRTKTYGPARLFQAEDSFAPEYDECSSCLQKCCLLSG